ncbi:deaminase [Rhodococcus sp. 06-470-2]|uniref:dihydrofolate reductase family protein n=1 Tax=unclassified Rhodococcus (in: high G+C Gram-positive bacteria) TaxID=192944 RepID=UPI000B9AECE4|nr:MULTISPECIES: dihydrofolate reductase family protein [unclassified Rhodococcus (in: high G+C Gram-positive bacteria)]OZC70748.1 deaminase [Rhodococcus sp. 06-470-2]OZE72051.1 deaminase [Rhodococcus sp. 05-2221-1B]
MAILTYNMHVSLDGFIENSAGSLDFSVPDEESHRFSNRQTEATTAFLFGRRLYEAMEDYWTDPLRAEGDDVEAEFARLYVDTPRIVFSDTLDSVADGCRLVRSADAVAEVKRLKRETEGTLAVGGAALADSLVDEIDQFEVILLPTILGGGKPYFPVGHHLDLTLAEQKVFAESGWLYLRYSVSR